MEKPDFLPTQAITDWYAKMENYDYNKLGFKGDTGHFTQVVWKSSTELNSGKAIRRRQTLTYFFWAKAQLRTTSLVIIP
ncbi:hypothetical protein [Nostoc sp. ChiQUE01b]|uniref:hypothetical protein n=1 Tax=Nostoc sp. ChiQUE01b TaxID=3075376 RepID=UPI003A0FE955